MSGEHRHPLSSLEKQVDERPWTCGAVGLLCCPMGECPEWTPGFAASPWTYLQPEGLWVSVSI